MAVSGFDPRSSLLLTDLYQLNMLQAYFEHGLTETAVFELFFRKLPEKRGFLMAAGLAQAVSFLEQAQFGDEELDWLARSGRFTRDFIGHLAELRFTGDVDAVPEGTIVFPDEPVLRVTAALPQAQLVESRLMNLVHFETVVASKAARMVLAAPGKLLVDFGLRRAHGAEAGLLAARAAYIAGFAGSATLLAEPLFGIPAFGTMAHSFIQAHDEEAVAFEHFARSRPEGLVLLIDTYDTEAGARAVVALAPRLAAAGITIQGVRLDSGDLATLARSVRGILDAGGLGSVQIFASGGLDEYEILRLAAAGAPIDGYGIGTSLTVSTDVPALDCAYKLQEYAAVPRRKRSTGKATWPGRKEIRRRYRPDGTMQDDVVATADEELPGERLIRPIMRAGRSVGPKETLATIRDRAARELGRLPALLRALAPWIYPVEVSAGLRALAHEVDARTGSGA